MTRRTRGQFERRHGGFGVKALRCREEVDAPSSNRTWWVGQRHRHRCGLRNSGACRYRRQSDPDVDPPGGSPRTPRWALVVGAPHVQPHEHSAVHPARLGRRADGTITFRAVFIEQSLSCDFQRRLQKSLKTSGNLPTARLWWAQWWAHVVSGPRLRHARIAVRMASPYGCHRFTIPPLHQSHLAARLLLALAHCLRP